MRIFENRIIGATDCENLVILAEKSLMKSVRSAQIHEDRNEEVERVERLRETGLIIFGLIGFIRFLVKSPVIICVYWV